MNRRVRRSNSDEDSFADKIRELDEALDRATGAVDDGGLGFVVCGETASGETTYTVDPDAPLPMDVDSLVGWVTKAHILQLAAAIHDDDGRNRFTEEQLRRAVKWADEIAASLAIWLTVQEGLAIVGFRRCDGQLVFRPKHDETES